MAVGLTALPAPVQAQPGAPLWIARYNGPGDFLDVANDVAVSPDGSTVFVTGLSDGLRGSGRYPVSWADYATIAYDAASAHALAVGPGGSVYVTGESHGGGYRDFATIEYAAA